MELIFATLFIILLISAYFYVKNKFTYWEKRGVYNLKPSFPFGNAKKFILQKLSMGEHALELYKQLKVKGHKFAGSYLLMKPELILLDPELVKHIMTKDFSHFSDRGLQYDEKNDPLTAHLLTLDGQKWKNMRQKLTPTFTSGKMKNMFMTLLECSEGLEDVLNDNIKKSEPIDIKDIAARFTTDIIGSCAFGLSCNSLKDPENEFRKYGKKVFNPSATIWAKRMLSVISPDLFNYLKLSKVDSEVNDFFMTIIRETIAYREKNNIKRNDFLQLLINVRNSVENNDETDKPKTVDNQQKSLTIEQIAAQSFLFFLAGFETSSTSMTFFFYDLATHQDIQDKVRNEINGVLKKYDNKLTYEGIQECTYLEKALNESMRLHAFIPVLQRRCTKNYTIPGTNVVIEKGRHVLIPVIGFQTDPEYYPNPDKYDPERFNPEEREKRHPYTFLPFGEGPRNCIGLRFGLLQTKVGIITLLKNHRFTLSNKTRLPLKMEKKGIIFSVEGDIWLNAEKI